jgi:DNA-binding response OmpR family regulator
MADEQRSGLLYIACRRGRPQTLPDAEQLRLHVQTHAPHGTPWSDWTIISSQKEALRSLHPRPPHAVLVEIDHSGQRLHYCAALRNRSPSTKILALGARPEDAGTLVDAALPLPVTLAQVVETLTRLLAEYDAGTVQAGPFFLDTDTRTLVTPRGQYHMTPKAMALLYYLMTHPNQDLSRSALMANVWDTTFLGDTRTLDVHIRWLRERIEQDPSEPKYLRTIRGSGYRLQL